jgi:segregation and condensation protein B
MEMEKIKSIVESILFVSGEPVKISRLAKITGSSNPEVENAVMMLQNEYANRGFSLIKKEDMVEMVTNSENSQYVSELIKSEMQENLSQAALEVLSIVAYRSPISRVDIEAIRGVNSSYTLRSLLMRGLLERIDNPSDNRGYLYKVSFDFLKHLGVDGVEKLPDWETLSKDARIEAITDNNQQN